MYHTIIQNFVVKLATEKFSITGGNYEFRKK